MLQEELQRFGDVRLALAAYNAGSPKVRQAMSKARSKEWDKVKTYLKPETQEYPDKVLSRLQKQDIVEA